MSNIRKIAPLIAVFLAAIIIAGSSGLTLIKHTCHHCGTEKITTNYAFSAGKNCCCHHDDDETVPVNHNSGYVFDNDCCTHESERLMTGFVVRSEVVPELIPHFIAAVIIVVAHPYAAEEGFLPTSYTIPHTGREVSTLHCQIIS